MSAIQLLKKNDEKTSHEPNIALALQISWVTSTESESGYVWPGKLDLNTLRMNVEIFESARLG